jgi:pimeloyl-ACP methyl ester carboxylesterase
MSADLSCNHEAIPEWYRWALAQPCESGRIAVDGAEIEWMAWGERDAPGILLVPGNGAHLGWWRHIAPFLAQGRRVATLSWSGMGGSDWRDRYSSAIFVAEAMAVAHTTGLFSNSAAPLMIGHSFGGIVTLLAAVTEGHRLSGAILVDARLRTRRAWGEGAPIVPAFRVSPTRDEALARFRLIPAQPETNRFILNRLAEEAAGEVEGGWSWRSDPNIRPKTAMETDLNLIGDARCPLMFIRGQLSDAVSDKIWVEHQAIAPPGTPFVEIPGAYHHLMLDQPIALIAALRALIVNAHNPSAQEESWSRLPPVLPTGSPSSTPRHCRPR